MIAAIEKFGETVAPAQASLDWPRRELPQHNLARSSPKHTEVSSRQGGKRVGPIDRGIETPDGVLDRGGLGRRATDSTTFSILFCGACASAPDLSTTLSRAFGFRATGLAKAQLCLVHLMRAALKYTTDKDSREVAADLKSIYQSATVLESEQMLDQFEAKRGEQYRIRSRVEGDCRSVANELS